MADDDATDTTAADETAAEATARLRSKNGVPRAGLETIDAQAQKIWVAARKQAVPAVTVARALTGKNDSKASGGAYRARIAALRVFKVIEAVKGGQFRLTDLGVALANTGDAGGHLGALRATMQGVPAYAQILARYDGGALPDAGPIATQFEFEYELAGADAASAADLFIESARYARLMDDAGNVGLDGVPPRAEDSGVIDGDVESETDPEDTDRPDEENLAEHDTDSNFVTELPAEDSAPESEQPEQHTPAPLSVILPAGTADAALSVKLDMSGWSVDDVLRVLSALGYENASRESRA